MVYFVNVRDLKSGYLIEDFCDAFSAVEYGSDADALAAATECYEWSLARFTEASGEEVLFFSIG